MEAFNPTTPPERRVVHSGTWNANPLVCSAGIAACKLYQDGEPQRKARERADYFRKEGNEVLKERGINGRLYSRTIVHLYLGPLEFEPSDDTLPPTKDIEKIMNPKMLPIQSRLCLHLLQRGIAAFDRGLFVLSAAHTREDIDQTVQALADSLDAMVAEDTLGKELING